MTFPLIAGIESSMGGFSMRKHVKSYLMWILLCEGMGFWQLFWQRTESMPFVPMPLSRRFRLRGFSSP